MRPDSSRMNRAKILNKEECNVVKTLVSIEVDLASSLAVRFVCQLGGLMKMEIHPVYVKESLPHESVVGAGWASRTWEKEIIEQGKKEISELIGAEQDFCAVLRDPRVIYGDRETELLKIAQTEDFDLYVEGVHFSWSPADLYKTIHAKLCQSLHSPLILVRTLRKVNQVSLLCLDPKGTEVLGTLFDRIWKECSVPLVLVHPSGGPPTKDSAPLRDAIDRTKTLLEKSGCTVIVQDGLPASPGNDAAEALKDQGLVAIAIDRTVKKDGEELQWLNLLKTSSLLAFH
jgi:hypothetical protein